MKKEISKSQIEKAVKASEKESRAWCRGDNRRSYQIMIDTDDAEIWADTYIDCNSWKQYRSDTIYSLDVMADGGRTGDAIRQLTASGWKITE